MERLKENSKGFTLLEVIIALGISSIVMVAAVDVSSSMFSFQSKTSAEQKIIGMKTAIFQNLVSSTSILNTINDTQNTGMICLRNHTDCTGAVTTSPMRIRDFNNNILFDSAATGAGFDQNGAVCSTFKKSVGSANCPFTYNVAWKPNCKAGNPCIDPPLHFSATFDYKFSGTSGFYLNSSKFSIQLDIQNPAKVTKPVVGSMNFYTNVNQPVTANVLASSWSGSTNPQLNVTAVSPSKNGGTTGINGDGTVTYTPPSAFHGLDQYNFTATNAFGASQTVTNYVRVMTPHTWTGNSGLTDWNNGNNWCGTVTGGVCPGSTTPVNTDLTIFDNTCFQNCSADIKTAAVAAGVEVDAGYGGIITQYSSNNITVGALGWNQSAGQFIGSTAGNVSVAGDFVLKNAIFTAPGATLTLANAFGSSVKVDMSAGTFNHNNGNVLFDNQLTPLQFIPGSNVFNNLGWSSYGEGSITSMTGTLTVLGNLGVALYPNHTCATVNGGSIMVGGNVNINGDASCNYSGSTPVTLTGNAAGQIVTGTSGGLSSLTIAAGTNAVKLVGTITIGSDDGAVGNFKYTSGTLNVGTSTLVATGANNPININAGTNHLYNFSVYSNGDRGNVDLGGSTLNVDSLLTLAQSQYHMAIGINNGTIVSAGDVNIGGDTGAYGTATVKLVGKSSGVQTVTGVASGNAGFGNLTIAAGSKSVVFKNTINIFGYLASASFTNTSGNVSWPSGSKLQFGDYASAISFYPGLTNYNDVTVAISGDGGKLDLGANLLGVYGTLTIATQVQHTCPIMAGGTIIAMGSTVNFNGCGVNGNTVIKLQGNSSGGTQIVNATASANVGSLQISSTTPVVEGSGSNLSATSVTVMLGTFNMQGSNFTINSNLVMLPLTDIQKSGGTLTVGGTTVANGLYSLGGFITAATDKMLDLFLIARNNQIHERAPNLAI